MEAVFLKISYVVYQVVTMIIRWPYRKANKSNKFESNKKTPLEKTLLFGAFAGILFLPLIFICTPFFDFANYSVPAWSQITGIVLMVFSAWLFYRSHKDLGINWSPNLEIRKGHTLVTDGIYKTVRHPMYTSIWLLVIAQPLVLNNHIAGWSGLITFGALYFLRVNNEEKMMLEKFGEEYREYMRNSKRLIPMIY